MKSLISSVVQIGIKLSGARRNYVGADNVKKHIEKCRMINSKPYKIPPFSMIRSSLEKRTIHNSDVYFLNNKDNTERFVIYIHSGSFSEQPLQPHWWFADRVAGKTNSTVIFPIYPKAPTHTYKETYKLVTEIYTKLLEKVSSDKIIIIGDSSGGCFAVSFAEYLKENNYPLPAKVITFSPWLDMTMENPKISDEMKKNDLVLGIDGLLLMGEKWAGGDDRHNYMLSPVYGNVEGLCEITILVGTAEFFVEDARLFKDKLEKADVPYNYYEYEKMHHCFALYPIPEALKAQNQIFNIIKN